VRAKQIISNLVFIKFTVFVLLGFTTGALSSIRSIFEIYQSRVAGTSDIRPWNYELIPTTRIFDFGVVINNFFGLRSENSNGWLSFLSISIIFGAIYLTINRIDTADRNLQIAEILFLVSFALVIFQYSFSSFSILHFIYYKFFNIMRGVSNIDLIAIPILLISSIIIINNKYIYIMKYSIRSYYRNTFLIIITLISIFQGIPGERETLSGFVNFNSIKQNLEPLTKYIRNESIVFHIPDTSYQGIPGRFNQILQVAHGAKIANGSYQYSLNVNGRTGIDEDNYLDSLFNEGVDVLTIHWNLMTDADIEFYEGLLLKSKDYKLVENIKNENSLSIKSIPISNLRDGLSNFSIFVSGKIQ